MAGPGFSSGIRRLVGRLNGRCAVLDENREIPPFADWTRWRRSPTNSTLTAARSPPCSRLFYLSRVMGTSIEMIGATYGHLVPDSEDYLRGLLDTFDANAKERTQSNG